jgi:hypothetical protein
MGIVIMNRTRRILILIVAAASTGYFSPAPARAQEPGPDGGQGTGQQQQEPDAQTEAAIQAAAAAAAAAAYQAGLAEAQQGDAGQPMQPGMSPTSQPSADEEDSSPAAATPDQPGARPGGGGAAGTPTTRPTLRNRMTFTRRRTSSTQPSAPGATPQRPKSIYTDYALLLHRSIFIKGNQNSVVDPGANGGRGPTTAPIGPTDTARPERNLIFNGVTESDAEVALVEDVGAHKVNKLHVGDTIASGKITRITFDSLDYEANGKVTTVQIGENFEGSSAFPTSGPSVYTAASPSGGTTSGSSAGGGSAAGAAPAVNPSVLERMRQRRMQETGGR